VDLSLPDALLAVAGLIVAWGGIPGGQPTSS
jgi:hypothetical protein